MLKISPKEFYDLTLIEFVDWSNSVMEYHNRKDDFEMQKLAWQTSLLLNGTGNYKRKINPKDLYISPYTKEEEEKDNTQIKIDPKEKEKRLADLKEKFGIT